jgi:hypothetical protein
MNHQDRNYLKALAYLYGKDSVPVQEYRNHLEHILGGTWENIYREMDKSGFLKLDRIMSPPSLGFPPSSYSITEAGTTYYESLLEELESIGKEGKQDTSRTNWTRIIGWGTLILIVMTGFLIWLELKHSKADEPFSKAMDSIAQVKFRHAIDSIRKATSDSIVKSQATDTVIVYNADGKPVVYPKDEPPPPPPPKAIEKHADKAILDSLEKLSPNKNQLVQIAYEKGAKNSAYAMELTELLKKNGYTKVTTFDDHREYMTEKKVYFLKLEQGYILVYINMY